jgi:hypothetical protein
VIRRHQIKTVVSVRLEDPPLHTGLIDLGQPDGELESRYVAGIGPRHIQWPLGEEAYWPWFTPWLYEEFFKLFDDPINHPVLVHCVGGRHRTGTFVALFQLEYRRRPVEEVLREMYSYDFGHPIPVQEHNLRTYQPRPLPDASQWQALLNGLFPEDSKEQAPRDYAELVCRLRTALREGDLRRRLESYIAEDRPFALCLAQRVIDDPAHTLAAAAATLAASRLQEDDDPSAVASAAALIADFGTPDQQQLLLQLLESEAKTDPPSPRYAALVAGVTNRYTPNRVPYLRPLLADRRSRPEPHASQYRYCDTAAARLVSIIDEPLHNGLPDRAAWDQAVALCQHWLAEHPDSGRLSRLLPPTGHNSVRTGTHAEVDGRNVR